MAVLGWATAYITKSRQLKIIGLINRKHYFYDKTGFLKHDIHLEELQNLLDTSCSKAKIMLAAGTHHIAASDGKRCVISTPKGVKTLTFEHVAALTASFRETFIFLS
jgi:hypothetical protein